MGMDASLTTVASADIPGTNTSAATDNDGRGKHIGEIDGLRAVAVVAVLLYHVGVVAIGGGFVGVDVFFVISGYLITGILVAELRKDKLSLRRFYVRRILRIAPALFVILGLTALLFYMLFPPLYSRDLLPSFASAALSYSNFLFYYTVDYFAGNSRNPVLHMWSLAVEEQFYLFMPLLLLLVGKSRLKAHLAGVLLALCLASLIAAGLTAPEHQAQAFYFPWLRAWELLAGSLLAVRPAPSIAPRLKSLLSNIGLIAILVPCFRFHDEMVFPGWAALLPVLGAGAIIAAAGSDSWANRFLQLNFMRWIGKISYSLYLVHLPVICVTALFASTYPGRTKVVVVIASFFLAWASWRFIESPFRRMAGRVPDRRIYWGFATATFALLPYFVVLQFAGAGFWQQFPKALEYSGFLASDKSFFREGTCFLSPKFEKFSDFSPGTCLAIRPSTTGVLVLGDSHAANIISSLATQHASLSFLQATAAGCKPTTDFRGPPFCTQLMRYIMLDYLSASSEDIRYVVLAARWTESDIEPLRRTISHLRGLGKEVVLYGPTPEYSVAVPLLLSYEQIFRFSFGELLANPERRKLDARFETDLSDQARYFSPIASLCGKLPCPLLVDEVPIYFDREHMTEIGARRIIRGFPLP